MGLAALGLDVMNHSDAHARSRATVSAYSLRRTVLVALLVTLVPILGVVAVAAADLMAPFLAGVATALAVHVARRWGSERDLRRRSRATLPGTAD